MPLSLTGRFDPERFNSTTLAQMVLNAVARTRASEDDPPMEKWDEMDEDDRMQLIDIAQSVIDDLTTLGILQ